MYTSTNSPSAQDAVNNPDPFLQEPLVIGIIGPWGAGKTSIINDLERSYSSNPERVAIIFAEFGEENVDAARIHGRKVIEVKDRCICCHGAEALAGAIQSLRSNTDLILVETSGVSNGGNVRNVFDSLGLNFSMLGVVNSADFAPDDTEILDSQLPASDAVVLTHHYWLGEDPSLADPRLDPLRRYVKETCGREPDDFSSSSFGLKPETFRSLVSRSSPPVVRSPEDIEARLKLSAATRHNQAVLTIVLHEDCDAAALEQALRESGIRVKRAKGVIRDEHGRMREFDFVPGRSETDSDLRTMRFILQPNESRSSLFRGRPHAVLCSLDRLGGLSYEQFLSIGLPDLSEAKLQRAFSRYPDHEAMLAGGKAFPVYNKEGDRFYGLLYAIKDALSQIPTESGRSLVVEGWKRALHAYLSWRARGLELLSTKYTGDPNSSAPTNLLALNLLWHLLNCAADISPVLREVIAIQKPATTFFKSCQHLATPPELGPSTELSDDAFKMLIQFAKYAIDAERLDRGVIAAALDHAQSCDESGTWRSRVEELKGQIAVMLTPSP